jgi:hypothetical protein
LKDPNYFFEIKHDEQFYEIQIKNMNGLNRFLIAIILIIAICPMSAQTITSNLPLLLIDTNGAQIVNEPKITAQLSVFDKGKGAANSLTDAPVLTCKIGIEIRGSSSQSFPKKSYGFETVNETGDNLNISILGLPAENDWVLYAPYNDKTFIRDIIAHKLFRQMGHYSSRYVLCELYLNNDYHGVYVLFEKIKQDKNRVNITKLESTDISGISLTGGYIFKIDKPTGADNEGWASSYLSNIETGKKINFLFHDPSGSKLVPEQKEYIKNFLANFEKVLASENYASDEGYRTMIDVNSFVDYFILNEVSKNIDSYRTSSFYHKDRDDKNNKLVAGPPWDYNLGFGNANYYSGNTTTNWVHQEIPASDARHIPFWWQRSLNDPVFYSTLKQRYTNFRNTALKTENIHKFIDSLALALKEPQARNYTVWKIMGKYTWPNSFIGANYQQEIDYLKQWISDRLTWIDTSLLILGNQDIVNQVFDEIAVVYPNPFLEYLYVDILPNDESSEAVLEIFDLTGKKLFVDNIQINPSEKTQYSLNEQWGSVQSLSRGTYILRIKLDSGKEFTGKIVKK